ncbi:MAG: GDSL-type esterase/lipase family protein [Planctomycetota bacterium]
MSRSSVLTTAAVAAVSVCLADARAAGGAARLEDEVRRYEAADRRAPPKTGGVLFLGDSNVREWETLEADMPGLGVVRRGFERARLSRLADFAPLLDRVAAPHKPSVIVLWCGAEDFAAGRTPEDVLVDFKAFTRRAAKALPKTKLLFVSMLGRRARPDFEKTNALIRGHCLATTGVNYLDLSAAMPTASIRRNVWERDGLTLSARGRARVAPVFRRGIDKARSRWADAMSAFARDDLARATPKGVTLFTGSSSIRMWGAKLGRDMAPFSCVNRGFGGSQISDVLLFFDEIVVPHDPAAIVLYCGENDITAGKSPRRVLDDFREFERRCGEAKPGVPVLFVSMKPSPSRWRLWPKFVEGNALVERHCAGWPGLAYVDVGAPMLGPDGEPLPDIWRRDRLHMNDRGYVIWTRVIGEALRGLRPAR